MQVTYPRVGIEVGKRAGNIHSIRKACRFELDSTKEFIPGPDIICAVLALLFKLAIVTQIWDSSVGHRQSILATIKRHGQKKARSCFGYKGLPLGFLLAGSSCVIETLWQLEHDCRVIFWARFFDSLVSEGKDVSETLRRTQVLKSVRSSFPLSQSLKVVFSCGFVMYQSWIS